MKEILHPPRNFRLRTKRISLLFLCTLLAPLAVALPAVPAPTLDGLRGDAILDHLNVVIDWYRHALTRVSSVGLPSDAMYQYNAQNLALQVVQLAFKSAEAEAALVPAAGKGANGGETTSQASLAKMQSDVNTRISQLQAEISDLNQQIASAPKAKRQQLLAQKETAQGELDLRNATHQALEQMAQFVSSNGETAKGGLEGSINELRNSVPELVGPSAGNSAVKTAPKPATATFFHATLDRLDWRVDGAL